MTESMEGVVELKPLPLEYFIQSIETETESEWTIIFDYCFNLNFQGMKNVRYVIGFTLTAGAKETAVLLMGDDFFSPVVQESTPFQVTHSIDVDTLLRFYDRWNRPPCYEDFVQKAAGL